jgi:hypothetical protein
MNGKQITRNWRWITIATIGGAGLICIGLVKSNASIQAAIAGPAVDQATVTIGRYLQREDDTSRQMEQTLAQWEQLNNQLQASPASTQVALGALRTNPFRAPTVTPVSGSEPSVDTSKEREQERRTAIDAFQRLRLSAIKQEGQRRSCVINNTLLQEGQSIQGFVIEQIDAGAVTVRRGAYRFEMRTP